MNNMTTDSNIVEEYMDFNNTSYYAATVGDGVFSMQVQEHYLLTRHFTLLI